MINKCGMCGSISVKRVQGNATFSFPWTKFPQKISFPAKWIICSSCGEKIYKKETGDDLSWIIEFLKKYA